MRKGKYVLSQVMAEVSRFKFNECVKRYKGEYWIKEFSCWEQFVAMIFGQLALRRSLRDVVVCLNAVNHKLYHLGFKSTLTLTTLSRANEKRDWRIYRDYVETLIAETRKLYVNDKIFKLELEGTVYAIDSTTIELSLNLFPWARLIKKRAAIKLNLGLELKGNIPAFFHISDGKSHDINFLDVIEFELGAYYILDRGYVDFARLYKIHQTGGFFVTRAKVNFAFKRQSSGKVDKSTGVVCDQIITLRTKKAAKDYPEKIRRIKYVDRETNHTYVFLTNDFNLSAVNIALLYKYRWQIELFFKWIKQHLSIESFWGRSENAVKTQICIALSAYLLVAMLKKKLGIKRNSYEILQILSISLFDKTPIDKLVSEFQLEALGTQTQKQAQLWGD